MRVPERPAEAPGEFEFWETVAWEQDGDGRLDEDTVKLTASAAAWWADTTPGNLRVAVTRGNLAKRDARGYRLADINRFTRGDVEGLEMAWAQLAKAEQERRNAVQAEYAAHGDFDAYMNAMARGSGKTSKMTLDAAADLAPREMRRVGEICGPLRDKPFDTMAGCDAAADIAPSGFTLHELNPRSRRSREMRRDADDDLSWSPRSVWD